MSRRMPFLRFLRFLRCALLAMTALAGPGELAAQPAPRCETARRVRAVEFTGSPRFSADTLAAAIVTRAASWTNRVFGVGDAPCADTLEVSRDALRLAVVHRRAGWFTASVTPRYDTVSRGVRITFDITPGPPATLDTVRVSGLPDSADGRRGFDAPLRALQGEIFDRGRVENAIENVLARLREVGYARAARPTNAVAIDTASARATLDVAFAPGRRVFLGDVEVAVQGIGDDPPRIDSAEVMRLIGLRAGQRYRSSALLEAQRDLYRSEAFRLVVIDTAAPVPPIDSLLDLRITVSEARTKYARVGVGWATQDCGRVQGRLADRGFLGVGRRAEVNVRASKLGVGAPADFASGLCARSVRDDPFSERLNYYAGVSFSDTRLFGTPVAPVLSIYSERRGEPYAFLRETSIGALLELTRRFTFRTTGTAGMQYENGRTETDPVISCSRFAQCRPEDYALSLFGRAVGIVSTAVSHDRTNGAVNPARGQRVRGELRAGQTFSELVSSLRFYRTTAEGSAYFSVPGGVFATRLQLSRAFAPGAQIVDGAPLLPQQERLFAGGQNSVRGFQQNLLGPIVYVITDAAALDTVPLAGGGRTVVARPDADYRALPRGGTALVVANLEYRFPLRAVSEQLQLAAFVDIGNVWETAQDEFRSRDLRATPGLGFRLGTPLGPFRLDLGYSPYPPRAGRALFLSSGTTTDGARGTISCASPGNTVNIDQPLPGVFDCPASYAPPRGRNVLSRLVFHFGLGQAF